MTEYIGTKYTLEGTNAPQLTNDQIVGRLTKWINGIWFPPGYPRLDEGPTYIQLNGDYTNPNPPYDTLTNFGRLFITLSSENAFAPLLTFSEGVIVQKDFQAGGFLGSGQGALFLGHGLVWQCDRPKIVLAHAAQEILKNDDNSNVDAAATFPPDPVEGQIFIRTVAHEENPPYTLYKRSGNDWVAMGPTSDFAGGFDTLYITQRLWDAGISDWTDTTPGNLNVGNLTVQGDLFVGGESYEEFTGSFINGVLTLADDNSIMPATDGHSSIGESTKMWNTVYTRNIIMGKYSVTPGQYITFSVDNSGTNITVTTTAASGSFIPASGKSLDIGSAIHKWDDIYCNTLHTDSITDISNLTVPDTITIGSGPAAISFTTGIVGNVRYLIPGGGDKTVALGSSGHYLKYVDSEYIRTENIQHLNGDPWDFDVSLNQPTIDAVFNMVTLSIGRIRTDNAFLGIYTTANAAKHLKTKGITLSNSYADPVPNDYGIQFGPDTNLYRSATNTLRTNDSLVVDGTITTGNGGITIGSGTLYWQTSPNPDVFEMNAGLIVDGAINCNGLSTNQQIGCSIATGTAPISVTSTTLCPNLNADRLDGHHWSEIPTINAYANAMNQYVRTTDSPTFNSLHLGNSGIYIGGCNLYWQTGPNPDVLELNTGMIIDGYLNVSGISTTTLYTSGIATLNGLNLNNASWADVTTSRQLSHDWDGGAYYTYTNDSGRTKVVYISIAITGSGANGYLRFELYMTGPWGYNVAASAQNSYTTQSKSFTILVPPGWGYQLKEASHVGGVVIQSVFEQTL